MSELKTLLAYAAERGMFYREAIDERAIAPSEAALAAIEGFVEELPDDGLDDAEVLAKLDRIGAPASVGMTNPRYFGFVIGGSLPVTVATNWLTTAWDQNVGMHEITPAASTVERVAGNWLVDLLGLPDGTAPAFVTGATVANFSALAAARNRVYGDIGWDVEADGLFGAPPVNVVISAEAHPTLTKSLGMLGFGRERLTRVPVDGQGRMLTSEIPRIAGPTIVCTQAGNINTGSFDPIGEICDVVRPQGAWVHVDGAFGLWAAASARRRAHIDGFEKADSWATDGHKWLNVPYDSGLAFVRDPHSLRAAMSIKAEYLVTETEYRNPSDYTPELSRRARGIDVWAALLSLGRNGVEEMIDRCCDNAQRFADGLRKAGYEILNDVVLNQVLVSFGPPDATLKVIDGIQREGTCWCGSTVWQGRTAMRISVCNWATTADDVDRSLDVMIGIAEERRR